MAKSSIIFLHIITFSRQMWDNLSIYIYFLNTPHKLTTSSKSSAWLAHGDKATFYETLEMLLHTETKIEWKKTTKQTTRNQKFRSFWLIKQSLRRSWLWAERKIIRLYVLVTCTMEMWSLHHNEVIRIPAWVASEECRYNTKYLITRNHSSRMYRTTLVDKCETIWEYLWNNPQDQVLATLKEFNSP